MQLLLLLFTVCYFGDWPQFRGPSSDAIVRMDNVPIEWSDSTNIVWRAPIAGLGWSSPVVVEGSIYLTTAVPKGTGLSLLAVALDATSGKRIWEREVRAVESLPSIHAKNSHASPTPIVHEGSVFVHFGTLGTARLARNDGSIEWLCTELIYPPVHGSGGSPVLHDGRLAIVCDGSKDPFVVALDASTGKVVWKTPRGVPATISHSFVTPSIAQVDGKTLVLAPGPQHFAAYDLADGSEVFRVLAPGWSVVPQPIVFEDLVIYNHDYDNPELMAVRLGGKGDVTGTHVVWRRERSAPSTPTPVLVDGLLYTVSDKGIATCLDAKTGEQYWMERLGGNYSASPLYADGRILFLSEDGVATWVGVGKQYEVIRVNEISGRTFATPAFDGTGMYLRTDTELLKIVDRNR
ncbi:MAG: PQQ-binding-like beta-propeller repeat protein [Planctomycetota bacterium]|jgi:outer membrane protein assembly factor BamB